MPDNQESPSKELDAHKGGDLSDKIENWLSWYHSWYNNIKLENGLQDRAVDAFEIIKELTATQQALANLESDNQFLEEHIAALKNKLGDNCCACSYDKLEDVCMGHTPKLIRVQQALDSAVEALRIIAQSKLHMTDRLDAALLFCELLQTQAKETLASIKVKQ